MASPFHSPPAITADSQPLDTARTAFHWLVTGPDPLSVDGRLFPPLPPHPVPLPQVRARLLRRSCPQSLRDAVWAHLVLRARTDGARWTVGCVGMALPALTAIAAQLTQRFTADPRDIHAAVLTGFLTELTHVDLAKPRVMLRLRWAAYRAGHTCLREALDAPIPTGIRRGSTAPTAPWGHPDFVLARAVAEQAITAAEAELIGATRLEGVPLATLAEARDSSYEATKKLRWRAELRLLAYLRDAAVTDSPTPGPASRGDLAAQVADTLTITAAAHTAAPQHHRRSPSVTAIEARQAQKSARAVSPRPPAHGVQGCGRRPATPASLAPAPPSRRPAHPTAEVARCA
jgi:hypothetical protein